MNIDNISTLDLFATSVVNTESNQFNGFDSPIKAACEAMRIAKLQYFIEQDALTRAVFVGKVETLIDLCEIKNNYSVLCAARQLMSYLTA